MFFKNKRSNLKALVKKGSLTRLKSFLKKDGDSLAENGMTLLHLAVKYEKLALIDLLLNSSEIDIDAQDSSGTTPLLMAFRETHFEAAKLLLDANARIEIPNEKGQTTLTYVVQYGIMHHEGYLMSKYRDKFFEIINGQTPELVVLTMYRSVSLKSAVALKSAEFLTEVLQSRITISDSESRVLVVNAMYSSYMDNLRIVLSVGPDLPKRIKIFRKELVSLMSGPYRNLNLAEKLLKRLIEWNILDHLPSFFYFEKVFQKGDSNSVRMLLNSGIIEHVKQLLDGDLTACLFANKSEGVINILQDLKFDVNARGINGLRALHFALVYRSEKNMQLLLDRGADVNVKDDFGITPIFDAEKIDYFMPLLSRGADVQVVNDRGLAAFQDLYFDIMEKFVKHQCVLGHLAILEAQGMQISQEIRTRIQSKVIYQKHFHKYRCYINRMKNYIIYKSITLFTILTEDPKDIERLMRNSYKECERTIIGASIFLAKLRIQNPYYFRRLQNNAIVALKTCKYRNKALQIVAECSRIFSTDDLIVQKIVDYLTYEDLCIIFK